MGDRCELCEVAKAVVYCKLDGARLCLRCDANVHSTNPFSRRHLRSLVCNRCNSEPAVVRCFDEKLSLCRNCDCNGQGCNGIGHQRFSLNFYSCCPAYTELLRAWSSVLDVGFLRELSFGLKQQAKWDYQQNESFARFTTNDVLNQLVTPCVGSSSSLVTPPNMSIMQFDENPPELFTKELCLPQQGFSSLKGVEIGQGNDLCQGFNMDDFSLSLENKEELLGCARGHSKYPYENAGGVDPLCMQRNISVAADSYDSNGLSLQALLLEQHNIIPLQSPCVTGLPNSVQGFDSGINPLLPDPSCNRNMNMSFPIGKVNSSMSVSVSNLSCESSAADYQDCGVSPMFLPGEPPWDTNLETCSPQARDEAKISLPARLGWYRLHWSKP